MAKGWSNYLSNALELFTDDLTLQQRKEKNRKMQNILRNTKTYSSFDLIVDAKAAEEYFSLVKAFENKAGSPMPSFKEVKKNIYKKMSKDKAANRQQKK